MKNEIWFCDTETGGLDPNKHSILSMALVQWIDGEIKETGEWAIDEGDFVVNWKALQINKINLADPLIEWQPPMTVCNSVASFVRNLSETHIGDEKPILGGHNTPFDIGFIKRLFRLGGLEYKFHYHYVDTLPIARYLVATHKLPPMKTHLTSLCDYFGVKNQGEHTALGDALATAEVYTKMLAL